MIETEGHTTHERLSDWDILDQYNSLYDSDPSAANKFFAELYNRHSTYVHGIALRIVKDTHTADDIVMTTFTRLFRHRERLDSQRASNLKPLLKTIASRLAINSLRGKKRLAENSLTTAEGGENAVEDTSPDPYENLERSGDIIIIRRALARIGNYANRETFRLAKIKELSYKEIADHSNVPIGTVMSRCHWGRKSFTENMAAYYTASEFEGSDTEMLAIIAAEHPNRMRSAIAAIPGEKRQHMLRRSIMEGARNIEISTEMDTERQTFNSQLRKAKLLLGAEIRLEPK